MRSQPLVLMLFCSDVVVGVVVVDVVFVVVILVVVVLVAAVVVFAVVFFPTRIRAIKIAMVVINAVGPHDRCLSHMFCEKAAPCA